MEGGGPAFPVQGFSDDEGRLYGQIAHGMTLRDYFAAAALGNMSLRNDGCYSAEDHRRGLPQLQAEWVASAAFRYADAMLAERDRREREK